MSEFSAPSSTTEYYRPLEVYVVHKPRHPYWLHALLLLATIFTTLVVGAQLQLNFLRGVPAFFGAGDSLWAFFPLPWILAQPSRLLLGIPFSATLMLILMAHEMGHFYYCRRYGVDATLPFFIPAPTIIGTLGAFIRIRAPIRSRTELFDIGIAGPIAGFLVAVVVLAAALGLSRPTAGPISAADQQLGYPLIFILMHWLLSGAGLAPQIAHLPFDRILLHPTAVAAWVGMFATALNLLPGGQLDGGHIVFALAPRAHRMVSRTTILVLLPMAYFLWVGWLLWAILLRISGMRHPIVSDRPGISRERKWLAWFALAMLVLTLMPAPFSQGSLQAILRQLTSH
jgi:membrane-associated protease RseP (regulator of RpoE activity)